MTKEEITETPEARLDKLQIILSKLGVPGQSDRSFLASLPPGVPIFADDTVYKCLPDHRLQITVGREAIDGYRPRTAVDIQPEHHVRLEPGTTLLIDKFTRLYDEAIYDINYYFSGKKTFVSLGSAALNLLQGGEMSVVESTSPLERY